MPPIQEIADIKINHRLFEGRVPVINYDQHPAYGGQFKKPTIIEQISALKAFWPDLKKQLKATRKCTWKRQAAIEKYSTKAESPITQTLAIQGALCLSTPQLHRELMKDLSRPYVDRLQDARHQKTGSKRQFLDNFLQIPANDTTYYESMRHMLTEMGIIQAAEEYLETPVTVHSINLQIGDAQDNWMRQPLEGSNLPISPLNYMHQDSIYHMLKCIWYLSPVSDDDGPFRFVMGSHKAPMGRLEYAIRSAQDRFTGSEPNSEAMRKKFWSLPPMFRKKAHFGDDILENHPDVKNILASEYAFTSKDGDLVLFDNKGMHRGSIFKSGSRINVQVMLIPKKN